MTHHGRRSVATAAVMPSFLIVAIACAVVSLPATLNLPLVDPGLFVLTGVKTCGDTFGYCLLGSDCTTDDDFLPDPSGNCDGLKQAFTPSAPFACCKSNRRSPPRPSAKDSGKKTPAVPVKKSMNEWPRITREHIDPLQMDAEQLDKLNQIGSVVKKIVEQLINETANTIREDPNLMKKEPTISATEANTIRNDESTDAGDGVEITETITVNPPTTTPPDEGVSRTEIAPYPPAETKDSVPLADETVGQSDDTIVVEPETTESNIDDEFRAEKNICQKTCKSEIIFAVDKKPLCYGTLLDEIWILTSATCASRLNKADIRKISATRKDWFGPTMSISNLLVHENFKSPPSKNSPDNNDLALASLNQPLIDQQCIPCFAQKRNMTNEMCRSFQNTNFKNSIKSTDNCEGPVQLRKLVVNSYLVLPCSRWRMQYNQEGRLGSGLWCDGKLAGVQTGVGVGSLIYTPVNEYGEWISDNKRIERRR